MRTNPPGFCSLGDFLLSNNEIEISDVSDTPESDTPTAVRPWARYVAKIGDSLVFSLLYLPLMMALGLALGSIAVASNDPDLQNLVLGTSPLSGLFLAIFAWVIYLILYPVLEALIIAVWSTTPCKALMGISVTSTNGSKLSFGQSLKRSYGAFLSGMGLGIPIIAIFAMFMSYGRLASQGVTSWDEGVEAQYRTASVNGLRWLVGVLVVLTNFGLTVVERFMAESSAPF
jgi:uncharacterized RDD family membrane protein YckC